MSSRYPRTSLEIKSDFETSTAGAASNLPPFGAATPLPPTAPPELTDLVTLALIDSKVFLR
jgi:hypothetical protein